MKLGKVFSFVVAGILVLLYRNYWKYIKIPIIVLLMTSLTFGSVLAAPPRPPLPSDTLKVKEIMLGITSCLNKNPYTSIWFDKANRFIGFFWPDVNRMNMLIIDLKRQSPVTVDNLKQLGGGKISFGEYNSLEDFMKSIGWKQISPKAVPLLVVNEVKVWIAAEAMSGKWFTILFFPAGIFINSPWSKGKT